MVEDLPDDRRPFDHGDDLHRPAVARADEGIIGLEWCRGAGPTMEQWVRFATGRREDSTSESYNQPMTCCALPGSIAWSPLTLASTVSLKNLLVVVTLNQACVGQQKERVRQRGMKREDHGRVGGLNDLQEKTRRADVVYPESSQPGLTVIVAASFRHASPGRLWCSTPAASQEAGLFRFQEQFVFPPLGDLSPGERGRRH